MLHPADVENPGVLIQPEDDAIIAAPRDPSSRQFEAQRFGEPARVLRQRHSDELGHRGGDLVGQAVDGPIG